MKCASEAGALICVGVIAAAHGVRGQVTIKSFTEVPGDLTSYGPLSDVSGKRQFIITPRGQAKGALIVAIAGITDRDQAEGLRGTKLYLPRAALPPLDDQAEYYHADLIGLAAEDAQGRALGRVKAVHNFGAGDLIELETDPGQAASAPGFLPFTKTVVPEVDLAGGRLVIALPEEAPAAPAEGVTSAPRPLAQSPAQSLAESRAPWTASVLTLFPEMFPGPLGVSLAGKALEKGLWGLAVLDIRDFAGDKHRSVDDQPFGGGPGMVLRPDVIDAALEAVEDHPGPLIALSPRGRILDQARAQALAAGPGVRLLCGRYEGIDERVLQAREIEELSIGDYVLSGGEPAALVLIDAVIRLLPGVLGNAQSPREESFERGLLEYPHYTRPAKWRGLAVPEVLTSGNHEKIRRWRRDQAESLTKTRRPDLWARQDHDDDGA